MEKRGGFFIIDRKTLRGDERVARAMFDTMIVLHTEARFDLDEMKVFAIHPSFDLRSEGDLAPEYVATIHDERDRPNEAVWVTWCRRETACPALKED